MKLALLAFLCSIPAWGVACTMQTINGSDSISTGPAKINSNFSCLNGNKTTKFSGAIVPGTVTGSTFGDFYQNTATGLTYQCFASSPPCTAVAVGNWTLIGSGGGGGGSIPNTTNALRGTGSGGAAAVTGSSSDCVRVDGTSSACPSGGTGDVNGPGSATDNAITRYDGTTGKLVQNSAATVDDSGNITANSYLSNDTSHSGGSYFQGLTSGGVMLAVADIAGTAIVYVLPSTNGTAGQFLEDNGATTCPTLASGSPAVCHQLIWAAGGGGGGSTCSGSVGQILVSNGTTGCTGATPTISGSTITASLTGHASLDVAQTFTLTGGAGIAAIGDLSTNRTIATASGEADFLASGALTCGAATQGKMQVHTTPLEYCDNAATPTLRYAAYGDSAGVASSVAVGSITGLGTGVATALATNVSGTGAICLASGSACSGGGSGSFVLIEQHSASSSASLDFTTCISSTYDDYVIDVLQVIPATNNQAFNMLVSTDGGSTYDSGNNYRYILRDTGAGGSFSVDANATAAIRILHDVNQTTSYSGNTKIRFFAPGSSIFKTINFEGSAFTSDSNWYLQYGSGMYQVTTAVNAFQFKFASGNITSGIIRCYGIAK